MKSIIGYFDEDANKLESVSVYQFKAYKGDRL